MNPLKLFAFYLNCRAWYGNLTLRDCYEILANDETRKKDADNCTA